MAKLLIQQKNCKEVIYAATEPRKENLSLFTIERLLSGAAEEDIQISFLFFTILGIDDLLNRFGIRRVRKLVSELLFILVEKTPDDLYADCLSFNEYVLLLPGVSKEKAYEAGVEIRKRFLALSSPILQDSELTINLAGCVIAFPEDGKTTVELLCQARDALSLAADSAQDPIQIVQPVTMKSFSLALPEIQMNRLKQLAQKQALSESFLIQQALDEFLHTQK